LTIDQVWPKLNIVNPGLTFLIEACSTKIYQVWPLDFGQNGIFFILMLLSSFYLVWAKQNYMD